MSVSPSTPESPDAPDAPVDTAETGVSEPRPLALEVELGGAVQVHALPAAGEVVLGRSRTATLQLDHTSVSREHVRLRLGPATSVEDLGSRNGTFVRGERIAAGVPVGLGVGDAFEVGSVLVRLVRDGRRQAQRLREEVVELERARIEAALAAAGGTQSEAARRLGMSRGALLARLRAWGLVGRSKSPP